SCAFCRSIVYSPTPPLSPRSIPPCIPSYRSNTPAPDTPPALPTAADYAPTPPLPHSAPRARGHRSPLLHRTLSPESLQRPLASRPPRHLWPPKLRGSLHRSPPSPRVPTQRSSRGRAVARSTRSS